MDPESDNENDDVFLQSETSRQFQFCWGVFCSPGCPIAANARLVLEAVWGSLEIHSKKSNNSKKSFQLCQKCEREAKDGVRVNPGPSRKGTWILVALCDPRIDQLLEMYVRD